MTICKCDFCGRELRSKIVVSVWVALNDDYEDPAYENDQQYTSLRHVEGSREMCRECFDRYYRMPVNGATNRRSNSALPF